jgi:hypothetical protein
METKMVELNGSGALVLPGFFGELSPTGYKARDGYDVRGVEV